eukprot:3319550-Amphidinium_carterae.3
MELEDILTFTVHGQLVDKLFQEYQRTPPPGWSGVSVHQVMQADKRAFKLLHDRLASGLGKDALGESAAASSGSPAASLQTKREGEVPAGSNRRRRKGQGKGLTAAPKRSALDANAPKMPSQKRICFSFNLGHCDGGGVPQRISRLHEVQ